MHNWYIVTGRMAFDDEDTAMVTNMHTLPAAINQFRRQLWASCHASDVPYVKPEDVVEDTDIIYILYVFKVRSDEKPTIAQAPC